MALASAVDSGFASNLNSNLALASNAKFALASTENSILTLALVSALDTNLMALGLSSYSVMALASTLN